MCSDLHSIATARARILDPQRHVCDGCDVRSLPLDVLRRRDPIAGKPDVADRLRDRRGLAVRRRAGNHVARRPGRRTPPPRRADRHHVLRGAKARVQHEDRAG